MPINPNLPPTWAVKAEFNSDNFIAVLAYIKENYDRRYSGGATESYYGVGNNLSAYHKKQDWQHFHPDVVFMTADEWVAICARPIEGEVSDFALFIEKLNNQTI